MSVRLTFNRLQGAESHPRPCCHLSFPIFHLLVFYSPRPIALKAVSNTIFFLFHQRKKNHSSSTQFFPHPQYLYIFLFIFFLSLFDSACTGPLSSSWWCRRNSRAENVLPGWNFDGENIFCLLFFQLSTCDCEFVFVLWRRKYSGICCKKRLSTRYLR